MDSKDVWLSIITPILIGPLFLYIKSLYDTYIKKKKEHQLLVYNSYHDKYVNLLNNFYWPLYIKLLCIYQLNYYIPLKNEYEYNSESGSLSDTVSDNDNYNVQDHEQTKTHKCSKCKISLSDYTFNICKRCKWSLLKENIEGQRYNKISNSDSSNDSQNDDVRINIMSNKNNNDNNDIIIDKETINLMEKNLNNLYNEALMIIENNIYLITNSIEITTQSINFIKYCKMRPIINDGSINKKYNIEYLGIKNNINVLLNLIKKNTYHYQTKYNLLIEQGPFH